MEISTKSPEETQKLGKDLAQKVKNGGVICLYGDLGSGKTTFTQGLLQSLGIKRRVVSPTFIFIREYEYESKHIYHIDLYRIKSLDDAKALGMEEILSDEKNIVIIEWPEQIKDILPKSRIDIRFNYLDENERRITISN